MRPPDAWPRFAPEPRASRAGAPCLAPGGVYPASRLTAESGELLPRLFTLAAPENIRPCGQAFRARRYLFCGTFRRPGFSPLAPWLAPGTLLYGVRKFLPGRKPRRPPDRPVLIVPCRGCGATTNILGLWTQFPQRLDLRRIFRFDIISVDGIMKFPLYRKRPPAKNEAIAGRPLRF